MEKNYFSQLDLDSKQELLLKCGEIIKIVEINHLFLVLFMLDVFFVEMQIESKSNELVGIEIQEDANVLHTYVNDVDLSDLLLKH